MTLNPLITSDHFIDHTTTIYGDEGEKVRVFVRERVTRDSDDARAQPVALFVHGGTYPSVPDFDLAYQDYSWMAHLARAGFHVFMMDFVGYGRSSRPALGDLRNLTSAQKQILKRPSIADDGSPDVPDRYRVLRSPQAEWADMDAVISFIRNRTGVHRLSLIGWSGGGPRAGGYAALHPEAIDKVVLLAPAYGKGTPDVPLQAPGLTGAPLRITTRTDFEGKWDRQIHRADQLDPAIREALWSANMDCDPVGASWEPEVVRGPNISMASITRGWNDNMAANLQAPALLITGEWDADVPSTLVHSLYEDIGAHDKVFALIKGASHYIPWEKQHRVVHELSAEWLRTGSLLGVTRGELTVDASGAA